MGKIFPPPPNTASSLILKNRQEQVNIPLEIIPVGGSSPNTFQKIVQLQSIIRAEDKTSYQNSLKETSEG